MQDRIKNLRKEMGLNQADVAERMHVSRGTYSSYENGITPPSQVVVKIAAFFDVSTDYLLGISNERKPASGKLAGQFESLQKVSSVHALTASEVSALLDAGVTYYKKGAPCGDVPLDALRGYIAGLTDALLAAARDDVPTLLDSANAAGIAALDVSKMVATYFERKKETDE